MMIPQAARPAIGRIEFTRSLGVTNRIEAETLAYPIIAQWKAAIAAAGGSSGESQPVLPIASYVPSSRDLEEVALTVGYEEAGRRVDALIRAKARLSEAAYNSLAPEFERRHLHAIRSFRADEHDYWKEPARRAAARLNWILPDDSLGFDEFVKNIARCGIDLFASARAKVEAKEEYFQPSTYVREAVQRRTIKAKEGEQILDLFDKYLRQRLTEGKKKEDTLRQDRKVVELFSEFVGVERSITAIEKTDVREWRNTIVSLPLAYKNRKAYENLDIRQAAGQARKNGDRGISLITANKYLSAVSALFIWARREGYVDANPCDGLFYDADKKKNARPPFSGEQLNAIIKSPLFTGFAGPKAEHKPGRCKADDWRYWIPLICLFTGARLGEVAQLRISDIVFDDCEWYFLIENDDTAGLSTKNKQSRIAPMHSLLREVGFLQFVERVKLTKEGRGTGALFPELSRNDRGHAGLASRFWREYLKRIGVKTGADGFGSHSFRHGLADQLRRAGCFDNEVAVAIGHKQATVTSGYGVTRQGSAKKLNQMIEGARFEGVDFSGLMANAG